jgi:FixJ family two-component response regulator
MSLIPKKCTVYVVDDDEAVRDSLQWLLEGKDYRVRCFDSAESFISRYDPREVACLIADIRMGGMTGLELQDRLIERKSPLPIVFITGHGDVPMAVNTMKKGAMDFIQKPFKEEELLGLVERMLDEARDAFADYQQAASRDALLSKLTGREAQVLERIVAGRLNKQIADDLGISIKTVEAHRANIMEKLNANTVADLLKIALGQNAPKAGAHNASGTRPHPSGVLHFSTPDRVHTHDRTHHRWQCLVQTTAHRSGRARPSLEGQGHHARLGCGAGGR